MADGASPTLSPKEAIALGKTFFDELMEEQETPRLLLEGLQFDSRRGNWIVTFGFDSEREKPFTQSAAERMREGMSPIASLIHTPVMEILREFRSIHLSARDGKFVKLERS
jgi:hypothetical protein